MSMPKLWPADICSRATSTWWHLEVRYSGLSKQWKPVARLRSIASPATSPGATQERIVSSTLHTSTDTEDVAVIGMACLFPGAPDLATFWQNIVGKVDAITDPPPE